MSDSPALFRNPNGKGEKGEGERSKDPSQAGQLGVLGVGGPGGGEIKESPSWAAPVFQDSFAAKVMPS